MTAECPLCSASLTASNIGMAFPGWLLCVPDAHRSWLTASPANVAAPHLLLLLLELSALSCRWFLEAVLALNGQRCRIILSLGLYIQENYSGIQHRTRISICIRSDLCFPRSI